MKPIAVLKEVPAAFALIGAKINELIRRSNITQGMKVKSPLKYLEGDESSTLSVDMKELASSLGLKAVTTPAIGGSDAGASSSGGTAENLSIEVIGSDGKLNKVAKHSSWVTPTNYPTEIRVVNSANSVIISATGLTVIAGSNSISLSFASIARNMSIRTISVCDGTTTKSMDIIASAPY